MIKLVPIEDIKASEYNPRKNDEKRLTLTETSLRKLGFVLPIYADTSGEILSGHQRHLVAVRMGFSKVPVQYVNKMELEERKNVNVLFNRATNDLKKTDNVDNIKKRLYNMDIQEMISELPDIEPDSEESFPCVYALKRIDTATLAKKNHKTFDSHIRALSGALERSVGSSMPIVISEEMEVINGIGRLQVAAETGKKIVQCVTVTNAQKELASAMLNLLSMDFSLENEYADVLRYNSFRRERTQRETNENGDNSLGNGFYKGIFPKNKGRDFTTLDGSVLEVWKKYYGDKIVDFGAGNLSNTHILRNAGIFVSAFEPYFVTTGDKIHKAKSIEMIERFLNEVESGKEYTTVFISSVLNSVPFMQDRIQIARIAAALCYPDGKVVAFCQSNKHHQFTSVKKKTASDNKRLSFSLNYEPNVTLGDISRHPKVQKAHTKEEMLDIFSRSFNDIRRIELIGYDWYLEAAQPKLDLKKLGEAIDFEFNLPYPDGTTMGMSERARQVFEKRLGITIPGKEETEHGD